MTTFATDLNVPFNSTVDILRERFNSLLVEFDKYTPVGELSAIQTPVPNNTSLVSAVNYIYNLISSEGVPVNFVALNECYVPFSSALYFTNNSAESARFTQISNASNPAEHDLILYSKNTTKALHVLYSGQVGIGKVPGTTLDVNGTCRTNALQITNDTYTATFSYLNNSLTASANSPFTLGNQANKNIFLNANALPGNVGIGYTETETVPKLLSLKSGVSSCGINLKNLTANWTLETDESGALKISDAASLKMIVTAAGKVGIANSSPATTLSIGGDFSASDVYFTGKLYSGSVEIVSSSGVNVSLKNLLDIVASSSVTAGSVKIGATTVIETDAKVDWNKIKNVSISTTNVNEGTNLYYTSGRVLSLLSSAFFNLHVYSKAGLLAIDPITAGKGSIAYISDTSYEGLALSDGADWKYIALGATIV